MTGDAAAAVTQLSAAIDAVLAIDLDAMADDEVLELVRSVETQTRRAAGVEHRLTGEVDRRGLAHEHGCASTAVLLSQLLRLSASEARARVRAAERLGRRRTMAGEPLDALHPATASAQAAGEISPRHAALVTAAMEKVPPAMDEGDTVAEIERFLVEQARQFAPEQLARITRHLLDVLDPDGTLKDSEYRDRHRTLELHQRADGSVAGRFDGTAEFGELLLTLLDVTAAPRPAEDGTRDRRSPGQRRHDGLLDAMRLALRAGELPTANGVVATIVLSMTAEQWAGGDGLARTGHGASVPVADARRMAGGEARIFPVVTGGVGGGSGVSAAADPPDPPPPLAWMFRSARPIAAYGTCHRIYTEGQRLAMIERDGGCTFPGCTVPALWCEADHVTGWSATQRTSVDDGHLVCPHHHREKDRNGWRVVMIDGLPHWQPPGWIDPLRTPRRNRSHDPLLMG